MIYKNSKYNSGFIALMSAIIISVILLLIITNLSLTSFYNRSNILDGELKEQSLAFAEGCVDIALLRLAQDPAYPYPSDDPVDVDGETGDDCTIVSVSGNIIRVQGIYNDHYFTNFEIKYDPADLSIISWQENADS